MVMVIVMVMVMVMTLVMVMVIVTMRRFVVSIQTIIPCSGGIIRDVFYCSGGSATALE